MSLSSALLRDTFKRSSLDDNLFQKINKINFTKSSHTVGPKSISKQELIKEFSKIF